MEWMNSSGIDLITSNYPEGNKARQLINKVYNQINEAYFPPVKLKREKILNHCNELILSFNFYSLIFRAYDDGIAYRFAMDTDDTLNVIEETGSFNFAPDDSVYLSYVTCRKSDERISADCFHTGYEESYTLRRIDQVDGERIFYLPVLVKKAGRHGGMVITETALFDYPGMYLQRTQEGSNGFEPVFPAYPLSVEIFGKAFPQELVTERAPYLARTYGVREYPWRVILVVESDEEIIESDLVIRLGGKPALENTGWIRPGKCQSEWLWNNILYDVDFKSGYNTKTYKYYADFAEKFGLGWLWLDAGWSDVRDLKKHNPELDLGEVIRYAAEKELGVFLWMSAFALGKELVPALDRIKSMGAGGIMVDFLSRDDQVMLNFMEDVAREAARRELLVIFHGVSKPAGLETRYPNVITREAVKAYEYNKWSDELTPEHHLLIPFIRMVAGPLDYEPGGMRNTVESDFRAVDNMPMTLGTRIHQLAMFVVFESPLSKMGGNVSDYMQEPQFTTFMADIPTVWNETEVIGAKTGDYVIIKRVAEDGSIYIGAMTDWTARDFTLNFSFLDTTYKAQIYQDGLNADRYGGDYKAITTVIQPRSQMFVHLAAGGGWVAKLYK